MSTIGIIGFGFVGKAVYYGFRDHYPIIVYDPSPDAFSFLKKERSTKTHPLNGINIGILSREKNCDYIFVCVPTPTDIKTGQINLSIIEKVISEIDHTVNNPVIIIKSTIIPGTCRKLVANNNGKRIIFNPEFLTEKHYIEDFLNQRYVVLGGNRDDCVDVARLYRNCFDKFFDSHIVDWEEAEMLKYMTNCMLAAKVGLCNEFYKICQAANIKYNQVLSLIKKDKRFGPTHFDVPGIDRELGFGGKCFPKDLVALIGYAKNLGIKPQVLETIWNENLSNRKKHDWLEIPGALGTINE